jgi:hypothetical protein
MESSAMDTPWTTKTPPDAGPDAFVMASRFELKSAWRSPAFLLYAMRILRQTGRSPGLHAVTLRAHPVRGEFWTLSAWTGEDALREFARTDPHRSIMKAARPWMKTATFRFWSVPVATLSPKELWQSAEQRIADGDPAQ